MTPAAEQCALCQRPISDRTVQVTRGDRTYCCPNCAAAAEQGGSAGRSSGAANPQRCAECGVAIVDRSTVQSRGGQLFCCSNCLNAVETFDETPA